MQENCSFIAFKQLIKKKKKRPRHRFSSLECLHAAQLLSVLCSTENQFAPFRINRVQFPRICLFHSFQMRLWTNRVTLKISIANPFPAAWQSLCTARKVEHRRFVCTVFHRVRHSLNIKQNGFKITGSILCQVLNTCNHPFITSFSFVFSLLVFFSSSQFPSSKASWESVSLVAVFCTCPQSLSLISIPYWNPIQSTLFV